jgi:hypothetical protein
MNRGAIFTDTHKRNLSLSHKGKSPWNKGRISRQPKICPPCNSSFYGKSHATYCSRSCAKKGNTNMLGKRRHFSQETRQKMSIAHIGKCGASHPKWIADRTKLKTSRLKAYDSKYKGWMFAVKNRDGWKCKLINGQCSGRLEAHHIFRWADFPKQRYVVDNGIALCKFHHPRTLEQETKMIRQLTNLIYASR